MAEISRQSSRQERPFVRIGWSQGKSPYLDRDSSYEHIKEQVKLAVRSSSNFGVQTVEILYQKWYTDSGDCDLFVHTAADRERLIYNSASWLPFLENAPFARIKIRNPSPEPSTSPATEAHAWIAPKGCVLNYFRMTWTCGDGPYKNESSDDLLSMLRKTLSGHSDSTLAVVELTNLEIDPYCGDMIVYASEEDVAILVNKSELWTYTCLRWDELELHDQDGWARNARKNDYIQAESLERVTFRIRWNCPNPPYKKFNDRHINAKISNMLHAALQTSGSPSLSVIYFPRVEPKWVSGDVDVYTNRGDRERAIKYAYLWFPHLIQGEHARIPGTYYPQSQAPEDPVRRKSNTFKRTLEEVSVSQTNLSRSQSRSAKRKRQKIRKQQRRQEEQENHAPHMSGHAYPINN